MNKLVTFSCLPLIVIISTVDSLNRLKRLDSRLDRDHRSFESSFEKRGGRGSGRESGDAERMDEDVNYYRFDIVIRG